MVRRESFIAPKKNARRGPGNYRTEPWTTDCKRAIDTIVEKHDYLLSRSEGDSRQQAAGSSQSIVISHLAFIIEKPRINLIETLE
jgi:hypothetical protein